jgi:hypothetical protein
MPSEYAGGWIETVIYRVKNLSLRITDHYINYWWISLQELEHLQPPNTASTWAPKSRLSSIDGEGYRPGGCPLLGGAAVGAEDEPG